MWYFCVCNYLEALHFLCPLLFSFMNQRQLFCSWGQLSGFPMGSLVMYACYVKWLKYAYPKRGLLRWYYLVLLLTRGQQLFRFWNGTKPKPFQHFLENGIAKMSSFRWNFSFAVQLGVRVAWGEATALGCGRFRFKYLLCLIQSDLGWKSALSQAE